MTEHVCEWNFIAMDDWAWCRCGKTLNFQRIETRLNEYETLKAATERLSAERARQLSDDLADAHQTPSGAVMELYHDDINAIKAYADILEGKDG